MVGRLSALGRGIVAIVTAMAAFSFVMYIVGAGLARTPIPSTVRVVVAFLAAFVAGVHVARFMIRPASPADGWRRPIIAGALVVGACVWMAVLFQQSAWSRPVADTDSEAGPRQVAAGEHAMVVSASPIATRVGVQVLKAGGNAVDAAVSVAFALAVTYPGAGNIGGGGLMLARMNGETVALDFRETAPLAATRDMYVDAKGHVTDRSITGALAVGVPGSVAGLWTAHRKYGVLPWRDVVQPAIDLAENGFIADSAFAEGGDDSRLARYPASAKIYQPNGMPVVAGTRWSNPDLAYTLRLIAERGVDGFYTGETAQKIVAQMQRDRGIISLEDLKRYQAKWRTPIEFTYRGYRVLTMPPVSSGGLTIALMANILSGYDLHAMGWHSVDAIHVMAEAERVAYARRNSLLADPDFVKVPTAPFLSPDTAAALRRRISMVKHAGAPVLPDPVKGRHTTHFSVVDAKGNAVSLTTTLNTGFGSAVTVSGAGFVLNNEMDDFTAKPGVLNAMGLRQGEANAIVPGKRMLSSMTPTIVLDSTGATYFVVGAAGGARIITAVAQLLSDVIDFRMPVGDAMTAGRFHAQDYPDTLELSGTLIPDSIARALAARGHHVKSVSDAGWSFGWAQAILRSGPRWTGATEARGNGLAAGY
jgi:gamma-glutamyltranspeptidase/glutathione hydrolase